MKFRIFATLMVVILLGACRTVSVYDVRDAAVVSNVASVSKEDVRKAIIRAGSALGWQIQENGPNALVGTLKLREHIAVVDIPYSAKQYSIVYKSSTNLNYDGATIHSNYNGWIQNLQKGINSQLNTL